MATINDVIKKAGAATEGKVEVDISYDIIRQFSAQLYTNPRKAIEELITNSYDAGADECWVRLPKASSEALAVLDDGEAMDLKGIKDLWRVAHSPKAKEDGSLQRIENNRMQVGKFGVGKLAAFALGGRLTYITCVDGNVRVVSVGQSEIREKGVGRAPTFDVYKLPLSKAKAAIGDFFKGLPVPWGKKKWKSWTLALVEEIDEGKSGRALKVGILKRMIVSALPISADFKVFLEGQPIPKQVIKREEIEVEVRVTDPKFRAKLEETIQIFWQRERDKKSLRCSAGIVQGDGREFPIPGGRDEAGQGHRCPQTRAGHGVSDSNKAVTHYREAERTRLLEQWVRHLRQRKTGQSRG